MKICLASFRAWAYASKRISEKHFSTTLFVGGLLRAISLACERLSIRETGTKTRGDARMKKKCNGRGQAASKARHLKKAGDGRVERVKERARTAGLDGLSAKQRKLLARASRQGK